MFRNQKKINAQFIHILDKSCLVFEPLVKPFRNADTPKDILVYGRVWLPSRTWIFLSCKLLRITQR